MDIAAGLEAAVGRARSAAIRLEEPLAARLTIGAQQAGELGAELRRLSALEADAARDAADAVARAQAAEVVVARLGGSLDDLSPEESASREQLVAEAASLLALAEASRGRGPSGRRPRP